MNWAIVIALMVIGYFLLRFGMVSRGRIRSLIQFIGGSTCTIAVVASFILLGWKGALIFIGIFFFVITPIVEVFISKIDAKISEPYNEAHEYLAQKYGTTPEEVKKTIYKNM
jgi:multisubunit Na+/H+ antiporter MnhG subunit